MGQPATMHQPPVPPVVPTPTPAAYTFADEFTGPAGSLPDTTKWLWDVGPGASIGGNNETENYGTGFAEGTIWNSTATRNQHGRSTSTMDGGFHTYRMDWVKGSINLYCDNTLYASATSVNLTPWPFDGNGGSYCLLNIAVNGTGTGGVKPNPALLPAKMLVDYVHCWT